MKKFLCRLSILFSLCLLSSVHAAPITMTITGEIDWMNSELEDYFDIGDPILARIIYETSSPDTHPANPDVGYYNAVYSIWTSVGPYSAMSTGGDLTVENGTSGAGKPLFGRDYFNILAYITDPSYTFSGPAVGDMPLYQLIIEFSDPTLTIFDDISIPASFNEEDFETHHFKLAFQDWQPGGYFYARAIHSNNLTVTFSEGVVPEPATLLLLSAGLIGLATFRKRFKMK